MNDTSNVGLSASSGEASSQPNEIPPALPPNVIDTDGPSLGLRAFVAYLRARSTGVDTASTREFNAGNQFAGIARRTSDLGGVRAITLEPQLGPPDFTVVYYHGGGYVSGSPPDEYLPLAAAVALAANARVHVVDYRLAPETRFPGAYDDCVAAYQWIVRNDMTDLTRLAVIGDSAGGNLALAVTIAARDQGLPLPGCVAVMSPFADMTFSGRSVQTRKDRDPYVSRELLESMAAEYIPSGDRDDPRCSVVFANLHGLPPLLIQVGENEILYDDATRIRDAAENVGVAVTFESWRDGIHVWPVYVSAGFPESAIAIDHLAAFIKSHLKR